MPCYHPLTAYRQEHSNKLVFDRSKSHTKIPLGLACGQCIGCRLEKSRHWAIRCMHESSLHQDNCFITLTYDDQHLPPDHSLHYQHFQNFLKYLRRDHGQGIRFYMAGEYGEPTAENNYIARPHWHACIFNHNFQDLIPWKKTPSGDILYTSESLSALWPKGHSTVGTVTFESAAYCARYIMKKINGPKATDLDPITGLSHYEKLTSDGEIITRRPEFNKMSLKPGLGHVWYQNWKTDVYPSDTITHRGKAFSPPSYYDNLHETENPKAHEETKARRRKKILEHGVDLTPERMRIREKVKLAQLNHLKRTL
nr:MAG: replication initiation protein [Microvirus sp.]